MAVQIAVEVAVAFQVVAVPVQTADAAVVADLGWQKEHLMVSAVQELQNSRLQDSAVGLDQKFGLWLLFRLVFLPSSVPSSQLSDNHKVLYFLYYNETLN